jgi:type I restriction enzyme S subunit
MVVTKGYKQTEIGVIPEDWEVIKLDNLSNRIGDGIHSTPIYNSSGEYYFVNGNNLVNGKIVISDGTKRVTKDEYLIHKRDIDKNTVFLSINGTIGNIAFYNDEKIVLGKSAAYINLNDKIDKRLLYQLVHTESIKKYFDNELTGSTIKNLGLGSIRNTPIPLPPTKAEQTAIATALSDMDELIDQTEKLIEKKKAIKQGVMQELLRPKEGWVKKYLPGVCWFQEGPGVRKHQFRLNGVKLLNGTNIQDGKLDLENTDKFISNDEAFGWYSHFLVDEFDVLIACSGVSIEKFHEKVTIAESYHLPLCMNTSTMRFKVNKEKLDQSYFIQFLKSKRFKEQISGKATGSAQLNFGPSHVNMVEIDLPELNVQKEIGKILNDMEFEVSVMELKHQKLKNQKQGMMQALLTGKIRLV